MLLLHILSLQTALFKDWNLHRTAFLPLGGQPGMEGDVGYCNCRSVEGVPQSVCKNEEAGGN